MAFEKFQTHPLNALKLSSVLERSAYPLKKYVCFSPFTSRLESFGHKSTPTDRPWIEAYCPKFELAWKWVGPRMLKGQLSRIPWPGNSWMPFTFQPAFQELQQPHEHSSSLHLAIHTQLAHHYIQYTLSALLFLFFIYLFIFLPHQSTKMALGRDTSHIKVTRPPGCRHRKV